MNVERVRRRIGLEVTILVLCTVLYTVWRRLMSPGDCEMRNASKCLFERGRTCIEGKEQQKVYYHQGADTIISMFPFNFPTPRIQARGARGIMGCWIKLPRLHDNVSFCLRETWITFIRFEKRTTGKISDY